MQLQMFTNILLNISILTIIAMLITGIAPVKKLFTDQDQTQTSDEMLDIANNLTMKDMWAAA